MHPNQMINVRHDQFENGYIDPPYFERMESSEFMELQESRRINQILHHRVQSLEVINMDLENRLEHQARLTLHAEQRFTDIDKAWKQKYVELEKEMEEWKDKYEKQTKKTERVNEHLHRTERELYGILQRKYQLMRGGPHSQDAIGPRPEGKSDGDSNVHSLKQILSLGESSQQAHGHSSAATPLSESKAATEDLCDVYKKLTPELRTHRFLMDMGDFLGI